MPLDLPIPIRILLIKGEKMSFIRMRDLGAARCHLSGLTRIGGGTFAAVYASDKASETVFKLTTDQFGYSMLADGYWLQAREEVDDAFPRVIQDLQDVGVSCGLTAYLVEVERLYPVNTREHRRTVTRIIEEYTMFAAARPGRRSQPPERFWQSASLAFCGMKAAQEDEPYHAVFAALEDFFGCFGGALDLKRSNFMTRQDGALVWNDVVFDIAAWNARKAH